MLAAVGAICFAQPLVPQAMLQKGARKMANFFTFPNMGNFYAVGTAPRGWKYMSECLKLHPIGAVPTVPLLLFFE